MNVDPADLPRQIVERLDCERLVKRSEGSSDVLLSELMGAIADFLQCDRCFLYLRQPQTCLGRVPFCWVRSADVPVVYDEAWKPEPTCLFTGEDPLFAAALRLDPSIFIDDVETASADQLNRQFERENFGHRALIHAHLHSDNQLWGVLQPCFMRQPHAWTDSEQAVIEQVVQSITPIAVNYVNSHATEIVKNRP
ncbi:GAF domain-containing protein [Myxacorys almedinensis]|uniref:GAF domain-containing protein n=1 Tax=Myxacorys almedinensis A TaxID=2690445 RepID=A0A8J7Z1M8_9CYAN|nr:GAF domain-containing protein [Myxacorys almedinensis]NDJ17560.1 GAF domain-containing protein [Myxacorys almedinensis A]